MIVTRSDIESFKRFVPKLALAGAAVLILSAFAPSSDAAVFTAREGDAPLNSRCPRTKPPWSPFRPTPLPRPSTTVT